MSIWDDVTTYLDKTGQWIEKMTDGIERKIGKKEKPMIFKVGEGLTPTQKVQAEKIVKYVPSVPVGEPAKTKTFFGEVEIPSQEEINKVKQKHPEFTDANAVAMITASKKGTDFAIGSIAAEEKVGKEISNKLKSIIPKIDKGLKERGFITSVKQELPELTRVAGQYVPRDTDTLAIKAMNYVKSNLTEAEKIAISATDDNAVAIGSQLLKHYSDEINKATDPLIKSALNDKAANIANILAHNLTEQGRAVQAASILSRLTPEGQIKFATREIQKYNEIIEESKGGILGIKKKIPELTGEQTDKIMNEMNVIQNMPEGEEKFIKFKQLQDYISSLVPSPMIKKLTTIWKAGLLTGLKTTGVNIFSNLSHGITEITKDLPATMIDKITSLITGTRTKAFTVKGLTKGITEGIGRGIKYLKTGYDVRDIATKLDYTRVNFGKGKLVKALQSYTDTVFKLLGAEDQPFYYAAKLRSLEEQVKVAGLNSGLKGKELKSFMENLIQNTTDDMIKYATIDAETAVFQNKTKLAKAARTIQQIGGGVGELVLPFGKTPSSVAMQIVNYSPVGIIKTIFENAGKGKFNQRLFSEGLGRGLTGTAIMALGAELAKKGIIALSRPTTEAEQKLWELEGRQSNSIKIGNKWRQVQVLGPAGNLLLLGSYFNKAFEESGSPSKAMLTALAGMWQSFTQQTFLTGVNQFMDAITDPSRSAVNVAGNMISSFIPTIVSDIARSKDPIERRTKDILEKIEGRVPFLRETLEPTINVLGKEKMKAGNILETLIDPTRPSKDLSKDNPVIKELRHLWDAGYKVSPTLLGDKAGYKGLSKKENTILWKRTGEIINNKISNVISSNEYQLLADDLREKTIDNFIDKAKNIARAEMVLELTNDVSGQELISKLSELKKGGLITREVFKLYQQLR